MTATSFSMIQSGRTGMPRMYIWSPAENAERLNHDSVSCSVETLVERIIGSQGFTTIHRLVEGRVIQAAPSSERYDCPDSISGLYFTRKASAILVRRLLRSHSVWFTHVQGEHFFHQGFNKIWDNSLCYRTRQTTQ
jgi:hypothetical protein